MAFVCYWIWSLGLYGIIFGLAFLVISAEDFTFPYFYLYFSKNTPCCYSILYFKDNNIFYLGWQWLWNVFVYIYVYLYIVVRYDCCVCVVNINEYIPEYNIPDVWPQWGRTRSFLTVYTHNIIGFSFCTHRPIITN